MLNQNQIEKIHELLFEVGRFQMKERLKLGSFEYREKGLNQLVSHVDVKSEELLVQELSNITTDAAFITEEDTVDQIVADNRWIIDPLDGTTNYLFGHEQFAISIAYQESGETIYGGIYLPAMDQLYYATNEGSYCNENVLKVSDRRTLEESLLATGFPYYDFKEINEYLKILHDLMKQTKGLRRMGSAAIDLAYTAEGRFDAFFELNLSPWDVAAGAFIVEQAGGQVSDFKGGEDFIFGRSIMAGNARINRDLLRVIQSHMR